jgi:metal-responsive CopG/Arc/MetJ family transcriptional regulator
MKRTLVDLHEKDLSELDSLALDLDTSRASILREAVAEYLVKRERVTTSVTKPLQGFGALKGYLTDGQIYQDNLRSEWE